MLSFQIMSGKFVPAASFHGKQPEIVKGRLMAGSLQEWIRQICAPRKQPGLCQLHLRFGRAVLTCCNGMRFQCVAKYVPFLLVVTPCSTPCCLHI
jgi:hypothetical protein